MLKSEIKTRDDFDQWFKSFSLHRSLSEDDKALIESMKIDFDSADALGPDPFHLRDPLREYTLDKTLSEILGDPEINLVTPNRPINKAIDHQEKVGQGEGIQPIHTAWLGGNLKDERRWENLKRLKELNPDTEIVMWVLRLPTNEPLDKESPMVKRCQALGVHVIPLDKVFGKKLRNPNGIPGLEEVNALALMLYYMYLGEPGPASDIARYCYLYECGGFHCDLDTKALKSVEQLPINDILIFEMSEGAYNGDPLAANKFCLPLANALMEGNRRTQQVLATLLTPVSLSQIAEVITHAEIKYNKYFHHIDREDSEANKKHFTDFHLKFLQTIITVAVGGLSGSISLSYCETAAKKSFSSRLF
jgi:hypothetical protein